jgi:multidrug efflux pump subunit AcrB
MSRDWKDVAFERIAHPYAIGCFLVMSALSLVLVMLMPLLLMQESQDKVIVTEAVLPDGSRTQVTARHLQEGTSYLDAEGKEIVRIEKYTVYNPGEQEAKP